MKYILLLSLIFILGCNKHEKKDVESKRGNRDLVENPRSAPARHMKSAKDLNAVANERNSRLVDAIPKDD